MVSGGLQNVVFFKHSNLHGVSKRFIQVIFSFYHFLKIRIKMSSINSIKAPLVSVFLISFSVISAITLYVLCNNV